MAYFYAYHKDQPKPFQVDMGYGFKPSSNNYLNNFDRHPVEVGSYVYVVQKLKGSKCRELVGKFQIIDFNMSDSSYGDEKTHRAQLKEIYVPKEPIYIDVNEWEIRLPAREKKSGKPSTEGSHFTQHFLQQGASFRDRLSDDVVELFEALLGGSAVDVPEQSSSEAPYREAMAKVRQGQEKFRKNVEETWNGKRCVVTGIDYEPLLIASHIVPFSQCIQGQHWDGANGIFLVAHLDALFDRHLITFIKLGSSFKMKWSKHLNTVAMSALRIKEGEFIETKGLSEIDLRRFESYMTKHNQVFEAEEKARAFGAN